MHCCTITVLSSWDDRLDWWWWRRRSGYRSLTFYLCWVLATPFKRDYFNPLRSQSLGLGVWMQLVEWGMTPAGKETRPQHAYTQKTLSSGSLPEGTKIIELSVETNIILLSLEINSATVPYVKSCPRNLARILMSFIPTPYSSLAERSAGPVGQGKPTAAAGFVWVFLFVFFTLISLWSGNKKCICQTIFAK